MNFTSQTLNSNDFRLATLTDEICNYNAMIEYVTIRNLFNITSLINLK
jgi:hypothetical protein